MPAIPEVIGTMGQLPEGSVSLIETVEDADAYVPADPDNLGYVTQTTLSVDDTAGVITRLHERFPNLTAPAADSICYATTNRQEVVKQAAPGCDLFIIVGAPNSSNSKRLVEVALRAGAKKSILVQRAVGNRLGRDRRDLDARPFGRRLGAGSHRQRDHRGFPRALRRHASNLPKRFEENEHFLVNRELRNIELTAADMAFVNG